MNHVETVTTGPSRSNAPRVALAAGLVALIAALGATALTAGDTERISVVGPAGTVSPAADPAVGPAAPSTTVGPLSPTTVAPSPAEVVIDEPSANDTVTGTVSVRGSAAGLPADRELWLVVRPLQDDALYPQGPGPLQVVDGAWQSTVTLSGGATSARDQRQVIFVVEVDRAGGDVIRARLADGPGRSLTELPPGAQRLAAVLVDLAS